MCHEMTDNMVTILGLGVAAYTAVDMFMGYHQGKVTGGMAWIGAITQKGRPTEFRRYMISSVMTIVLSLGIALWAAVHG